MADIESIDIFEKKYDLLDNSINIHNHHIDLKDCESLNKLVNRIEPTHVFHLASDTDRTRDVGITKSLIDNNVIGTINLLDSLVDIRPKSIVFVSTSEVYGENKPPFREDMLLHPVSPYSASKASAEIYCMLYHKLLDMPIIILRLFNVFGIGQSPKMLIPELILSCLNGRIIDLTKGEQRREFNYVKDVVEAIFSASKTEKSVGKIINVGCGSDKKIRDVVNFIVDYIDKSLTPEFGSLNYRDNEIWRMYCENKLAKDFLGWKPRYSFEEAVKETIEWYRQWALE